MTYIPTASQTARPFFNFALPANANLGIIAGPDVSGERIQLAVRVLDGDGVPTPGDAMIELWQADAEGRYPHPLDARGSASAAFHGFGCLETDVNGCCTFQAIRPGPVAAPDGRLQAPHITVILFARGLLKPLHTRVYFEGDPANASDPVLGVVPPERRATLMARHTETNPSTWRVDLVLQGDGETVFFDV